MIVINMFELLQERGVSKVNKSIGFSSNFRSIATKLCAMWALIKDESSTSWIASIEYYFCESTAQQEMKAQDIKEDQPYCRALCLLFKAVVVLNRPQLPSSGSSLACLHR